VAPYDTFYDKCLGDHKVPAECAAFEHAPATAACAACILTPFTAMRLGPILDYGGFVGGNVPGCIEVMGSSPDRVACASAYQALSDCEVAACQANCPVSDSASLAAREQCAQVADATGCKSYSAAVSTHCSAIPTAACTQKIFQLFYEAIVPLFCARVAPDGGAADDAGLPSVDAAPIDAGDVWSGRDGAPGDAGPIAMDAAHD
jgi:hypothetical protein